MWRRIAIDDAGGWTHDTLTEDLDLSYRAQLRGWRIEYRPEIVCPAELPGRPNNGSEARTSMTSSAVSLAPIDLMRVANPGLLTP